jgi:hypothetical protein
MMPSMAAGRQR